MQGIGGKEDTVFSKADLTSSERDCLSNPLDTFQSVGNPIARDCSGTDASSIAESRENDLIRTYRYIGERLS
jgi:hypothetical protein